ncbi:exodeoxyribonuclease V subunit alpha [Spirochaeta cellobiosiphila]|uniref:exodeoxyribonuclease V subunit alpha n=1 Tax=Spirochaeta cellobiosiphila TaxID=504483 RepID=UPI00041DAD89|nr:exodeoxyribonuclease V subunit alpha [Spirochaeta cellobiosiphila]
MDRDWEYLSLAMGHQWYPEDKDKSLLVCIVMELVLAGHICMNLDSFLEDLKTIGINDTITLDKDDVLELIADDRNFSSDPKARSPFIYKNNCIYFYNQFVIEQELAQYIGNYLSQSYISLDHALLSPHGIRLTENQLKAATLPLEHGLSIITGGPGTGKTTVLSSVLLNYNKAFPKAVIQLAAPTGRGAKRMVESISHQLDKTPWLDVIMDTASTVHKLLGFSQKGRPTRNKKNPFKLDLLIIDEASMLDFVMMRRILEAMPEKSQLLLVGDRDQLPSVEGGDFYGDILEYLREHHSSCMVTLDKSLRANSALSKVASCIVRDDFDALKQTIKDHEEVQQSKDNQENPFFEEVLHRWSWNQLKYKGTFSCDIRDWKREQQNIDDFFSLLNHGWILSPEYGSYWGVDQVNDRVRLRCGLDSVLSAGLPIMINKNDYSLGLYNGDRGALLSFGGSIFAFFPQAHGYNFYSPGRLPSWEPAFATTIHKSQGSEADEVLMIMTSRSERLMTKELFYTGVTRARNKLYLIADDELLEKVISKKMHRQSGLKEQLLGI